MKLFEIVEKIATAQSKEQAKNYMSYARENFPEFNWLMKLNDREIKMDGIPENYETSITQKDDTEFGKSIGWFWRAKTPFTFLMIPEGHKSFSPMKKMNVLSNMMNSIPFKEVIVFMTALKGELVKTDSNVDPRIPMESYKGILGNTVEVDEQEEDKVAMEQDLEDEMTVKVNNLVDNLLSNSTEEAEKEVVYVNPDDPTKTWKGKGRKPKWVVSHLDEGNSLDDLARVISE